MASFGKRVGRKRALFLTELAGAAAVIHGIGMWSTPSAWIVGGLAVVVSVNIKG